MSAKWEPGRNAVHGLIQLIDVLAIALHQFRQLSFQLPHYREVNYRPERQHLWDAYFAIKRAVFPPADIAPHHTATRIAHRAVAELARGGSQDEEAVGNARQWMTAVGWVLVPQDAPKDLGSEFWRRFDGEGVLLSQHGAVRERLLAALARIGQSVPDEIVQRASLTARALVHEGEEPVPQDVLLTWVRETAMSPEPPPETGLAPPQLSPAVARQLALWQAESARIANEMRTGSEAFESVRYVDEVWERVAFFTGREADRDGVEATRAESRAYYVDLLMDLGQRLRTAGFADRVQALDAGTDAPRVVAVELLQAAVAGDRGTVAYLDGAMRDAGFVGGGAAAAHVKNQLRYEVLGIRPPVPVPTNWEGPPPDNEIRTVADLTEWIDRNLEFLHLFHRSRDERNTGADVRNAHRLLVRLGVTHGHPFPSGGMTDGEAEAHLQNLRNVCTAALNDGQSRNASLPPAPTDTPPLHTSDTTPPATGGSEPAVTAPNGERDGDSFPPHTRGGPDGPFGADGFRFAGVEVRFGRAALRYRLVLALWDRTSNRPAPARPVEDVMAEVYGEGHDKDDAAFRQLCSDARGVIQKANCPLDIRSVQAQVQLARM